MSRYVAIAPRAWTTGQAEYVFDRPSCTVYETEREPIRTGLLNADGVPLFRMPEITPLGFCREKIQ